MVRGVAGAVRMSRTVRPQPLPLHARAYLARTDRAHRGTLAGRLREEVMAALPAPALTARVQARRASLSRSSSLKIGGSSTR